MGRKCKYCNKQSNYGILGKKAEYCAEHKSDQMVDLSNKRCISNNCFKRAIYGLFGQKKEYCLEHKSNDMIDLINKRCIIHNCKKLAYYQKKYCREHKVSSDKTKNNSKLCIEPTCNKNASFNLPGNPRKYCATHKSNMMVDVVHRICIWNNCNKRTYNKQNYCIIHKIIELNKCVLCEKIATYKLFGLDEPQYCNEHATTDMIQVLL